MAASVLGFGLAVPVTNTFGMIATYHLATTLYIIAAILIVLVKYKENLLRIVIEVKS